MDTRIPGVLMRGGTSKALLLHRDTLPRHAKLRDAAILSMFGSPDRHQIDGVGGAGQLTSKVAIVSRSERADSDVDYTFGQVGIEQPSINYAASCGNIVAAVGPFAIDEGLVPAQEPETRVRIYSTNTRRRILADVPVERGHARTEGDYAIDGVPGRGAGVRLTFLDPAGAITGWLLPTGQPREVLQTEFGPVVVSLVDSGTLYAFIHATHFGLSGDEPIAVIAARPGLMQIIDAVRRAAAARLMSCGTVDAALGAKLAGAMKVALVAADPSGGADVNARIVNPGEVHRAFAVTGAIALGSAACIPDSVVGDFLPTRGSGKVRIGHPSGRIEVDMTVSGEGARLSIDGAMVMRTARRIMDGFVYVHHGILEQPYAETRLLGGASS